MLLSSLREPSKSLQKSPQRALEVPSSEIPHVTKWHSMLCQVMAQLEIQLWGSLAKSAHKECDDTCSGDIPLSVCSRFALKVPFSLYCGPSRALAFRDALLHQVLCCSKL